MTPEQARQQLESCVKQLDDFAQQFLVVQSMVTIALRRYLAVLEAERVADAREQADLT